MGEFDRNATAARPNEPKKMVVVLMLGVVLIALVAWQMVKGGNGPQTAVGAPVTSGVALPPPVVAEEISQRSLAAMMDELQNDPTQSLLRQDLRGDRTLDAVPRNPFSMAHSWLAALINPDVVPPRTTSNANPREWINPPATLPAATAPATQPVAVRAEDFKLTSIINGNMAIINGKIVKVGDVILKARVIDIRDDGVTLQHVDFPTGPKTELSMSLRLNKDT